MASIQIQHELGTKSNCNELVGSNHHMWSVRTTETNANRPQDRNEQGLLWYIDKMIGGGDYHQDAGIQYWFGMQTGDIFSRTYLENSGHGDNQFSPWKQVAGGSSGTSFMGKPELNQLAPNTNVDTLKTSSGFFKTTDTTVGLPNIENPWGTLLILVENNPNAVTQMWYGFHGGDRGKMFLRNWNTDNWSTWREIIPYDPSTVYKHPTETLTQVDANTPTGFYKTTSTTSGMEGIPTVHKDGILKVTKDGDISIQRFQPSVEGSTSVYVRTISASVPTARQVSPIFKNISEGNNSHVVIHKESASVQDDTPPSAYAEQKFKVFYEIRWPQQVKLDQTPTSYSNDNGYIILKTLVGDAIDHQQGGSAEQRLGFILQYAYGRDGKVFTRKYKHTGEGTVPQGSTWEAWSEITGQGGGSAPVNFEVEMTKVFDSWKQSEGGSDPPSEKSVKDFIKKLLKKRYSDWAKQQAPSQDSEQKAFETYADKRYKLDFSTWLTFDDK